MGDDRDMALALDPLDQRGAAARYDDVDGPVHAEHDADGGAVAGRHQLDRRFGQPGGAQPYAKGGDQRARGIKALRPAAQDRGVAGFERQPAGVGGHVRPALIDDPDDAERHRDALDVEAVGPGPAGERAADRVGQFGDRLETRRDRLKPLGIERQPVAQSGRQTVAVGLGEIARVGGENFRFMRPHRAGGATQRGRLGLGRSQRQRRGGDPRAAADLGHLRRQIDFRRRRAVAR